MDRVFPFYFPDAGGRDAVILAGVIRRSDLPNYSLFLNNLSCFSFFPTNV